MALGFHNLVLKANGEAWAWGNNNGGRLGNNSITDKWSPILVIGNHSFIEVGIGGGSSHARKANGEAWSWGYNTYGKLGDGTITNRSSPVLVVGNHSFVDISSGGYHTAGLKENGEVWTWARNDYGQLGDGTIADRSSPVLVVGNHSFVRISTFGYNFSMARKANGEVWTWGYNGNGQLGDNTSSNSKSSPVPVVGNHSFVKVVGGHYHSIGLKANGETWAWGFGSSGRLGLGHTSDRSSPVLVIGNHSFKDLSVGDSHTAGLKENGEVWTWGDNDYGELGDNTISYRDSPVLVVGSHSFVEVLGNSYCSLALKANGEIWSWGRNDYGLLGLDDNISRSSPVLVVGNHDFFALNEIIVVEDIVAEEDPSSSSVSSESSYSSYSSDSSASSISSETTSSTSSESSESSYSSESSESSQSYVGPATVCWGHVTGVEEDYARTIVANSSGTGTVSGSGDSEKATLKTGEYIEFETWETGAVDICVDTNKYLGDDETFVIKYKTGDSEANCDADTWHTLVGVEITSLGWVKLRIEK